MPSERDLAEKFWKSLKSDRTIMIAAAGDREGDAQPMTAVLEDDDGGPIWIFTSKDTDFAQSVGESSSAVAQFASKSHEVFAAMHGQLSVHNDRAIIDRLWNPFVAAWYKGKDDPGLLLMRFDLDRAHIWLNENSVFAGVKMLLGRDPKKDFADKTADLRVQ
jgi:general stress protein 26